MDKKGLDTWQILYNSKLYDGHVHNTIDGRSKLKCYWTRASSDCGRLQIGDVTREMKFISNNYTNPNTYPETLTTLTLTLADPQGAFESFCAPVFYDFVRNYSCTVDSTIDNSLYNSILSQIHITTTSEIITCF